jgi:hypothetical protein
MDIHKAMKELDLKFTSGNNVEVERATILRSEYEAIRKVYVALYGSWPEIPSSDSDIGC